MSIVHGLVPSRKAKEHPNGCRGVELEGILDGREVFQGFGHFQALNGKVARV